MSIHRLVSGDVVSTARTFYIRGRIINHGLFNVWFPRMIDYFMFVMLDFSLID
jgi:hypothetical protein